jgi:hypothetical protein
VQHEPPGGQLDPVAKPALERLRQDARACLAGLFVRQVLIDLAPRQGLQIGTGEFKGGCVSASTLIEQAFRDDERLCLEYARMLGK